MRQFCKVAAVAVSVLSAYFGYLYLHRPAIYLRRAWDARLVMGLLDDYYKEKGEYPLLPGSDVPIAQLTEALATSGVTFRSRVRFRDLDETARYVSNTGQSYGLLYHFSQSGEPVTCIIEVNAHQSGWWKQPHPCPW
ncbi:MULTISPECIES: hypothetical protein [unclassified Bradyrhizobium]|uniref:hypothetical protein n=1 Tax=unclassified Bradyrhizobium TaxID=2631580 RepID=UPI003395CC8B